MGGWWPYYFSIWKFGSTGQQSISKYGLDVFVLCAMISNFPVTFDTIPSTFGGIIKIVLAAENFNADFFPSVEDESISFCKTSGVKEIDC